MERVFQISAVILAGVAAVFLWQGNGDGAFMAAVFGAVSFFLSVRFQVKERIKQRELAAETAHGQLTDSFMENENLVPDEENEAVTDQR